MKQGDYKSGKTKHSNLKREEEFLLLLTLNSETLQTIFTFMGTTQWFAVQKHLSAKSVRGGSQGVRPYTNAVMYIRFLQ